ncbi:Prefoldin alpha subunit [Ceraceosorus guamensis]|uniref:Prefoldin alpha subunit n=1 Tax=Ceraceosorus guamensis TaxID=1522189 RepID=A0A316W896_9BASI|nr:Prefoldin alpha subunit [Ceraceosorus guamensis]PWN44273.1 Prefoldin alpha subunit [Ceraceosorus guamensis]
MSGSGQIDVGDLTPQQLLDVRQQLTSELQHLTASYGQLKAAQLKFKSCLDSLEEMGSKAEGKESLIPLSASLYVPGKLRNTQKVIVDVGTGYYIEKDIPSAQKMYKEKISFVQKSLDELQATIVRKEDNMKVVRDVLTVKAAQAKQQQELQQREQTGAPSQTS